MASFLVIIIVIHTELIKSRRRRIIIIQPHVFAITLTGCSDFAMFMIPWNLQCINLLANKDYKSRERRICVKTYLLYWKSAIIVLNGLKRFDWKWKSLCVTAKIQYLYDSKRLLPRLNLSKRSCFKNENSVLSFY